MRTVAIETISDQMLRDLLTTEQISSERYLEEVARRGSEGAVIDTAMRVQASGSDAPAATLSPWAGWDQSNMPWSAAKHQDAVCAAVFGPTWAMEDAAALIGFINKTWSTSNKPKGVSE